MHNFFRHGTDKFIGALIVISHYDCILFFINYAKKLSYNVINAYVFKFRYSRIRKRVIKIFNPDQNRIIFTISLFYIVINNKNGWCLTKKNVSIKKMTRSQNIVWDSAASSLTESGQRWVKVIAHNNSGESECLTRVFLHKDDF